MPVKTPSQRRQQAAQRHEQAAIGALRTAQDALKRHDYAYAHERLKVAMDKTNLARAEADRAT
jgi:hypothetical protein